jgi:dienelactone hydrolase
MKILKLDFLFMLLFSPIFLPAQISTSDYMQAEKFLQANLGKHIYNSWVEPSWQEGGCNFVYSVNTRKGKEFFRVDAQARTKVPAFDQEKLALLLADSLKKVVKPYELPISKCTITGENEVAFMAGERQWVYRTDTNLLLPKSNEHQLSPTESLSPDGKWIAFIKDGNIYLKDKNSVEEYQLTTDGAPENGYGCNLDWYFTRNDSKGEQNEYSIEVYWSKDSKKLIVPRYDRRNVRRLQLMKYDDVEGFQSELISYERALAGDTVLTMADFYIFDVASQKGLKVNLPSNPEFLGTYFYTFEGCPKAYHVRYYRGYKTRELFEIDLETGKARSVLVESYPKSFVDLYTETLEVMYDRNEFIWRSEMDGWCHLYLYNLSTGQPVNQITRGSFYVYSLEHIDSKTGTLWFTAGGMDSSRNPYQKYLYSINKNGKNLKLLTPEEATHDIRISPDKKFFVDNYSSHKDPNIAVVRNLKDGKIAMGVEKTDIDDLVKMGWKPAETFSMLADDGETLLYGLIIRPTNFDSTKKYPVIDATYTGPHTICTPQTFSGSVLNMNLSLAELGFVVVYIDGRGSAYRSKAFHDVSYARLGYGLVDHVYAIKKLAQKYAYIDTTRVGIYGHSAGGYDATRGLLLFPEFYKVAVSSAGDHDHRMEKVWWPELYQGFPVDTQYQNQSNITNADKLKGSLLLATGDLDNNVNPSATIKLAEELTKANKDFELLILPNEDHGGCFWNKYFIRKRWDFFVRHLLGQEPPREYKIQ